MHRFLVVFLVGGVTWSSFAKQATAIVAFKKEFEKLYVTDESSDEFKKTIKSNKTACFACHQGKKRKNLNPYGKELSKLLDKKDHAKDKEAIVAALKKVEPMRSKKDDEKSPTYGELIKDNKLPGGPLEEVKKEPKKEEGDEGEQDGQEEEEEDEDGEDEDEDEDDEDEEEDDDDDD